MKKKIAFVVAIALAFVLFVFLYMKMEMSKEKVEGKKVENANAVYDELGIDISMPEEIDGTSDFEYSIIDEKIGRVSFHYKGTEYYLLATREATRLEEMGFVKSDAWWEGTTLYAAGDDAYMTGIESFGLEDGSSLVRWDWHYISFFLHSPKEYEQCGGFIDKIAANSYYQPTVGQQTTED